MRVMTLAVVFAKNVHTFFAHPLCKTFHLSFAIKRQKMDNKIIFIINPSTPSKRWVFKQKIYYSLFSPLNLELPTECRISSDAFCMIIYLIPAILQYFTFPAGLSRGTDQLQFFPLFMCRVQCRGIQTLAQHNRRKSFNQFGDLRQH